MTGALASLAVFWWAVQFISERSVVAGLRRFSTKATAVRVAPVGDINSVFGSFVKDTKWNTCAGAQSSCIHNANIVGYLPKAYNKIYEML